MMREALIINNKLTAYIAKAPNVHVHPRTGKDLSYV